MAFKYLHQFYGKDGNIDANCTRNPEMTPTGDIHPFAKLSNSNKFQGLKNDFAIKKRKNISVKTNLLQKLAIRPLRTQNI